MPRTTIRSEDITDAQVKIADMATDSVDSDQIAAAAVDTVQLAVDAVGVAELSATGTASATTFLRGDNSWTAIGDVGKVLQVVSSMFKGSASTTSNSLVTTGLEGTITPSATSSKILISISFAMAASGGDAAPWIQLFKGSSVLSGSLADVQGSRLQSSVGMGYNATMPASFNYLDSPSTTSATTYKLMYAVSPGRPAGNEIYMNLISTPNQAYYHTSPATMILMEIAA